MNNFWLTIFTPTYNRDYLLEKLFVKLCEQTDKSFIWLVVDDGSTDNTKKLIETLKINAPFEIKYIYQKNSGKQRAVNTALENCSTEWFAFCDSDDWYLPETVSKMKNKAKQLNKDKKTNGIVGRRCDKNLNFKKFPLIKQKEMILNFPILYNRYKFHAEICALFRTEILKEAKYPIINDKFIPESYMFDKYSQKNNILYVDEAWSVSEYLTDGLTVQSNKLYHNNPLGVMYALEEAVKTDYGFVKAIKNYINLLCWRKKYHNIAKERIIKIPYYLLPLIYICYLISLYLNKPDWIWNVK